jgi:hypothetical protein
MSVVVDAARRPIRRHKLEHLMVWKLASPWPSISSDVTVYTSIDTSGPVAGGPVADRRDVQVDGWASVQIVLRRSVTPRLQFRKAYTSHSDTPWTSAAPSSHAATPLEFSDDGPTWWRTAPPASEVALPAYID